MRKLSRAERRELTALRTVPAPLTASQRDRYIELAAAEEQEFHIEMARAERWERRLPALRTLADVCFWHVAIPTWVLLALTGHAGVGLVMVALPWWAWLGPRWKTPASWHTTPVQEG